MKQDAAITIRRAAGFIIAWTVITALLYPALHCLFSSYGEPVILILIGIVLLLVSRLLQRA